MKNNNTVTLTTYGNDTDKDCEFTVSQQWLENNIDMSLKEFLESYTFDDSEILLRLAMEQSEIVSMKEIGSII